MATTTTTSWIKNVLIAIPILVCSVLISKLKINNHLLNPFEVSEVKYDFYDLYFAKFGVPTLPPRTDIFLVNTFGLGRNQVAGLIDSINELSPKVISVDMIYDTTGDSTGTAHLDKVLSKLKEKVVIASALDSTLVFEEKFTNGFVFFPSHDGYTIRNYYDSYNNKNSFVNEIYLKFNGQKPTYSREKMKYINYQYDSISDSQTKPFFANSIIELSNESFEDEGIKAMVNGKIVLLGHINKNKGSIIDKHYTPLNKEYLGRSLPDMEGIMIHANILAMHLDKKYISIMPQFLQWLIVVSVLLLNVTVLIHFAKSKLILKDTLLRIYQTIQILVVFIFAIFIYDLFRVRIDLPIFLLPIVTFVDVGKFIIEKAIPYMDNESK